MAQLTQLLFTVALKKSWNVPWPSRVFRAAGSCLPCPLQFPLASPSLISAVSILQILTALASPSSPPRILCVPITISAAFILFALFFTLIRHLEESNFPGTRLTETGGLASLSEQAKDPGAIYILSVKKGECSCEAHKILPRCCSAFRACPRLPNCNCVTPLNTVTILLLAEGKAALGS